MKRLVILLALFVTLLAACGPDRAQTIVQTPVAAELPAEDQLAETTHTLEPGPAAPTTEPSAELSVVPATPTATPHPTEMSTDEPSPIPTLTVEATQTPTPTSTPIPPTTTPAPTVAPTQAPIADASGIDQAALFASLLTINDMPTGWTGAAPVFEPRTPGGTYTSFCTQLPARSIAAAYVEFEKSALGPFLTHSIVVYPDSANARAALDDLMSAAQNCSQFTDSSGSTNTISPLSFPSLGDDTFAVRSSGTVEMDAIYILVDNVLINIHHGGIGAVDSALTEASARLATERYGG